jgi:plastocyanin
MRGDRRNEEAESSERSFAMIKRAGAVGVLALLTLTLWVPMAGAGGGCHSGQFSDAQGVRVDLRDACFTPMVVRIQPGQSVTWTNKDQMAHTVTGAAFRWGSTDDLLIDQAVTFRFQTSGVFPYACLLHPGMVGSVVVGDGTSKETTLQAVVPVIPTPAAPTTAPVPAPAQPAPVTSVSTGVSSVWRVLAIMALAALVVVVVGGWAAQRAMTRRSAVRA